MYFRRLVNRYAEYADRVEEEEGKRARRALLKPVLGLFYGERNGKLYKSTLDKLVLDKSNSIGMGVMVAALHCLSDEVLELTAPTMLNVPAGLGTGAGTGTGQAAMMKKIYADK